MSNNPDSKQGEQWLEKELRDMNFPCGYCRAPFKDHSLDSLKICFQRLSENIPRASVAAVEGDVLSAVDHWATMYGRVAADNTELVNRLAEATEDGDLISRKEAVMVARDHDHRHDSGYRCYEGDAIAKKIAALPARRPNIVTAAKIVSRAITEVGFNDSPPLAKSWEEGKHDVPAAASSSTPAEPPPHDHESYKAGWDAAVAAIKTFGIDEIDAIENATAEPLQPTGEQELKS